MRVSDEELALFDNWKPGSDARITIDQNSVGLLIQEVSVTRKAIRAFWDKQAGGHLCGCTEWPECSHALAAHELCRAMECAPVASQPGEIGDGARDAVLDEMVRDFSQVGGWQPKSEVRRRILEYAQWAIPTPPAQQDEAAKLADFFNEGVMACYERIKNDGPDEDGILEFQDTLDRIKAQLRAIPVLPAPAHLKEVELTGDYEFMKPRHEVAPPAVGQQECLSCRAGCHEDCTTPECPCLCREAVSWVVKNRTTQKGRGFWDHVESVAEQMKAPPPSEGAELPPLVAEEYSVAGWYYGVDEVNAFRDAAIARISHLESELERSGAVGCDWEDQVTAAEVQRDAAKEREAQALAERDAALAENVEIKKAFGRFACQVMTRAIEGIADAAVIKHQPMDESHALAAVEHLAKRAKQLESSLSAAQGEIEELKRP